MNGLLADRMDKIDGMCTEGDAAVGIAAACPILQVAANGYAGIG